MHCTAWYSTREVRGGVSCRRPRPIYKNLPRQRGTGQSFAPTGPKAPLATDEPGRQMNGPGRKNDRPQRAGLGRSAKITGRNH